ncbi:ATP-binding protein [Streptomyces pathocidini]|uniref:histidine kinase n=1 Tax=Streptomyces pathocidini TaxID=1650571 RepID=A0ABW7UND6_9ACTN|nr:ATP-binding protein [Streptomyces pathocidini]
MVALPVACASAACTAGATPFVSASHYGVLFWLGGITTVVVSLASSLTARRALVRQRREHAYQESLLTQRVHEQEAAMVRLANSVLPQAVSRIHHGEAAEDVMTGFRFGEGQGLAPQFQAAGHTIVSAVLEAVQAEEDLRASGQRRMVAIARRVQSQVHRLQVDLRTMQERHDGNPKVFEDLLAVDHSNELIGRVADNIVYLNGGRPGQRWPHPMPLLKVLRGAMSKIEAFQRIKLEKVVEGIAITAPAVPPVMAALAELMDNATRYSPPKSDVIVTAFDVQNGIAIQIEDKGLGLTEEARERNELLLSQSSDLAELGDTPRLGLAVVGQLRATTGFDVALRHGAYGGVCAVLRIPKDLITTAPEAADDLLGIVPAAAAGAMATRGPAPAAAPEPSSRAASGPAPQDEVAVPVGRTSKGLPRRARRIPVAAAESGGAATERPADQAVAPTEPGIRISAFRSAYTDSRDPNSDPQSGKGE